MHEKEQGYEKPDHAKAPSQDDAVAAGRASRSSEMSAPNAPVMSGLLSRKARDENGVAAGAEGAVAAASSSSGAALPDNLMRKFENSLGTDLSSVRVHTGAESAAANDAVGAKAYAVGQDIHMGEGQYNPGSAAGEHLLAHEVAHTVQQSGGASGRQHKLEVSSPNDGAEHEADRAADAMVAGSPFTVTSGSAHAARKIHRKFEAGLGGKVTPFADGLVKFQVEGSGKFEGSASAVTASVQISAGAEAEVKWNPDASSASVAGKNTASSGGKRTEQWEAEIPVWKAAANDTLKKEAEKEFFDFITPVDASVIVGVETSTKPGVDVRENRVLGSEKSKPAENKLGVAAGIKCKTKTGDSFTVKVQLFEQKDGKITDVIGLKANYDKKFKSAPQSVKLGDNTAMMTVTGNIKPEVALKPNWAYIGQQVAKTATTDTLMLSMEAAALAGPPLLAALIIGQGIYVAGEKGARDSRLLTGAMDADKSAEAYVSVLVGRESTATGPIAKQAAAKAQAEVAAAAAKHNMTVEQMKAELQKTGQADYRRFYGPAWQQAHLSYGTYVRNTIDAWLKEHYLAAIWTTPEIEYNAVMKKVETVWGVR